ncbi:response regulator, partial [Lactobacillus nasalidis]|uniref:response regulator n=2 Tax=Lactobacillus nasalidis TaxID=2797258 RepID=UPI0019155B31
MSYPVFICDDDPEQIAQVIATLKRAEQILSDEEKIRFDLASQSNYQDAKAYLLSHPADGGIYFLDVELGQEVEADNGFDLAELIKKQDDRAQIIFLTSHADLSIITYRRRLGPVDYIVKGADPVAQR